MTNSLVDIVALVDACLDDHKRLAEVVREVRQIDPLNVPPLPAGLDLFTKISPLLKETDDQDRDIWFYALSSQKNWLHATANVLDERLVAYPPKTSGPNVAEVLQPVICPRTPEQQRLLLPAILKEGN